jgi:hypothetical protein
MLYKWFLYHKLYGRINVFYIGNAGTYYIAVIYKNNKRARVGGELYKEIKSIKQNFKAYY